MEHRTEFTPEEVIQAIRGYYSLPQLPSHPSLWSVHEDETIALISFCDLETITVIYSPEDGEM